MIYVPIALILGFFIPYISRRFAKFMPATSAYALWSIIKPQKRVKGLWCEPLYKSYWWRSILCGIATAALTWYFAWHFGSENLGWKLTFLWILLLLAEIDWRMFLLPDILTVPLLILGFGASTWNFGFVVAADSALGAGVGYFLPTLTALLLVWRRRDAFGGGDIKLLAALGAWLGLECLLYTILLASIGQMVISLVRRQKAVAFGPALAFSAIVIAIYFF